MRILLDNNADPNHPRDCDGQTALVMASDKGYLDIAKLLMDNDATPNVVTKYESYPLGT